MPCAFEAIENSCGCVIGYNVPLKTVDHVDITAFPVVVLNIAASEIRIANTPTEYAALWNSDTTDRAKGKLKPGQSAFCFFLPKVSGITPPSEVLGSNDTVPVIHFTFLYGNTPLDTTGDEPLEADYVSSVDSGVIATGGTLVAGSNVQVSDFENLSDKVLFIEVPATEEPFTKWSEVGNALQQDQPIDPDYATGSNVWYRSIRGVDAIYFTRSQTTFTGAVILSR